VVSERQGNDLPATEQGRISTSNIQLFMLLKESSMPAEPAHEVPNNQRFSQPKSAVSAALSSLIVALVYFAAARLSLLLALDATNASPIWPPSGIALAGVLLLGYRIGPGIFAGAVMANILVLEGIGFSFTASLAAAVPTALGNVFEAFLGAALIRRYGRERYVFETINSTVVFVIFGALLATMVSAVIGVSSFCAISGDWSRYPYTLLTWWLGDATGVVLIGPLILSWTRWNPVEATRGRIVEIALLVLLLSSVAAMTYVWDYPLKYLIIPLFLWAILRLGLFESGFLLVLVSGIAIYGAVRTLGPLTGGALNEAFLLIQSTLGVMAVTALLLSVAVSERRRAREALQAEKVFTDTVINSVPGVFYVLNREGGLIRWNRFLAELNDLSPDELGGMDSLRNITDRDKVRIADKIAEAFKKGESQAEASICTRGKLRHFLFTGKRIDADGGPYVVGTGIDITERRAAELRLEEYQKNLEKIVAERTTEITAVNTALAAEIRERKQIETDLIESEKKYRDLVEGANSVILRWTQEGRITFINQYAERFFGYSREEMVVRNIIGTIVPETESSGRDLSDLVRNIVEHAEFYKFNENENVRKNGERIWVSWTNRPITDEKGDIIEILSVGNDITARKLAEDRLKRTLEELEAAKERAEAADHLKSAFLATMSHELRTPLNSIIGFTGIILRGYVGPLTDEQAKQLGMVRNSANHLLSLINDVLDISKIEAGQLQVSCEPFDLPAAIEESLQSARPAADKKGLKLTATIHPSIATITSDRRRVEQILLNLIGNAVKFTETGSVTVDCGREDGFVTICVTDTGIGIREESMGKLFKAFQQVDTGLSRKYEGTGLGLYICQRLVEMLGGRIRVSSEWGKGSVFGFSLPDEGGNA
jgi:PAS domain S-box-containing protein